MKIVIGIDEVGRGAWAGPLVVGAVGLGKPIIGLADSKILSKSTRERLAKIIESEAELVGIGWVSPAEVDDHGLTKSMELACERALEKAPVNAKILLDGKVNFLKNRKNVEMIIDGDATVPEISAASIVAKVARDKFMAEQDSLYPGYGFDKNVGYGTKSHILAIERLGLTPIHRWSYKPIVKIINNYET